MKNIIKTCGLIFSVAVFSGADAATSRVSVTHQSASRRIPTIAGYIVSSASTKTSTTTTTQSVFTDTECIDAYTSCLKGPDVCGTDMEECTTNVLLHAKMPNCLNVLYQCPSSGVNALFGTTATTALSNVAQTNTYGEVVKYTYPTDGSILGQMVIGADLANKLPMDQCVRKYMNCAKRDSVCGENFELCTSYNEFKKQSIYCESTLARCQSDGLIELFGSVNTAVSPSGTSRLGVAIAEGAAFAAANAVNTCYKVIDTCLVNACTANPWRCVEGVSMATITTADFIAGGQTGENTTTSALSFGEDGSITSDYNIYNSTGQDVRKFIKGKCLATIGGNKYCYMTFQEKTPRDKDLADIDNQEDVFSLAYAARKEYANTKIQDILKKFDKRAKDTCIDTISRCAMTSCGGGVGSVCYKQAKVNNGIHVNANATYNDIMGGCEAVVNTDANCQYAANSANDDGYIYAYNDESVFTKLFPQYSNGEGTDPIGAVAALNASLSSQYNDAAIEKLKKQCQTIATGCIKSMCGTDFANCYRSRTDIVSGLYDTGTSLDKSMNKMGGILDYNIVTGLCVSTLKSAKSCEEHLKIEAAGLTDTSTTSAWGGASSVRDSWMDVAKYLSAEQEDMVTIGCSVPAEVADYNDNCDTYSVRACDTVDEKGCAYTEPVKQGRGEYTLTNAAETLLQKLLVDVEKEAQAKYNAKLTKEQHVCLANNNGGLLGSKDMGSTFMWAKLKSNKLPNNYSSKGLSTSDFVASNDLYGSFCRAKITILSADKDIQDNLGSNAVAYFAVGDPFVCGSWISQSTLENISKAVGDRARKEAGEGSKADKWAKKWWEIGGLVVGGLGGYAGMDSIQRNEGTLGGLLNPAKNMYAITQNNNKKGNDCITNLENAMDKYNNAATISYSNGFSPDAISSYNAAVDLANKALRSARNASTDKSLSGISFTKIGAYTSETPYQAGSYEWDSKNTIEGYINDLANAKDYCFNACLDGVDAARRVLSNPDKNAKADDIRKPIRTAAQSAKAVAEELAAFYADAEADVDAFVRKRADRINIWTNAVKNVARGNAYNKAAKKIDAQTAAQNFEDIISGVTSLNPSLLTKRGEVEYSESKRQEAETALKSFRENADRLSEICTDLSNEKEDTSKRRNRNLIAGAVTAIAGGVLTHGIVENYYDVKYENAENEAIKEWMENIGSKMKCYLGSEELGSYGQVVEYNID